jgi:hypothetical protein
MRHLILALLIALLPIRGWVGEVMATQMASGHNIHAHAAPETIADAAEPVRAGSHFDHEAAALAALPDGAGHATASHPTTHAGCDSCTVCQACHSVALFTEVKNQTALTNPAALPPSPLARFASADPAPGLKPPIS